MTMLGNPSADTNALLARLVLKDSVEEFFYREADLLDSRDWSAWLELFAEEATYLVPLQRNAKHGNTAREIGYGPLDTAWLADTKETLSQRVEQLQTGVHWAEEPASRCSHLISNIRIVAGEPDLDVPNIVSTQCRFLVYRNRVEREVDLFVGIRKDRLRRRDESWEILERIVLIEQNVLLSKNLTLFF